MDIKLIEFENFQRFTRDSRYPCPQCQQAALVDHWPGGASGGLIQEEKGEHWFDRHCICDQCKISFTFSHYEATYKDGRRIFSGMFLDIKPLVEDDGLWLTPSDVRNRTYLEKYGRPLYDPPVATVRANLKARWPGDTQTS